MRPVQVLDEKLTLLDLFERPHFCRFVNDIWASWCDRSTIKVARGSSDWATANARRVRMADCYYVSAEMVVMMDWAARALSDTDTMQHDILPTDAGFMWLDEPIRQIDVWGQVSMIRALHWNAGTGYATVAGVPEPGVTITFWADAHHPEDSLYEEFAKREAKDPGIGVHTGRLQPYHFAFMPWGYEVGPMQVDQTSESRERYRAENIENAILVGSPDRAHWPDYVPNLMRRILALWMLLGQTVTSVSSAEVPRAFAKRAGRAGIPDRVTVIELRRHAGARQPGESLVEWSHRWVVRGHWRDQPYKASDGSIIIKRIWIAPYVKGPADKPIVVTEKVYALVR